ncbi:hypothetical protein D4R30_00290 [archaeon]|nr:MAG: hypothetical protein D4R30_00290 [archaeon]
MSDYHTPYDDLAPEEPLLVETAEEPSGAAPDESAEYTSAPVPDEAWDAFELDEDTIEPEPEYGDFWGELDDDETI